jgi:hypothetical protein
VVGENDDPRVRAFVKKSLKVVDRSRTRKTQAEYRHVRPQFTKFYEAFDRVVGFADEFDVFRVGKDVPNTDPR